MAYVGLFVNIITPLIRGVLFFFGIYTENNINKKMKGGHYMTQSKLYVYHPNYQRATVPNDFPIHLFGSSSRGNATYIEPLQTVIDFGMSFKTYTDYNELFFTNVQYILLTHQHSDHLNLSAMYRVLKLYPHIKFVISPYVRQFLQENELPFDLKVYAGRFIELPIKETANDLPVYHCIKLKLPDGLTFKVLPVATHHGDLVNTAYYIYWTNVSAINARSTSTAMTTEEQRLMYASDLDNTNDLLSLSEDHRLDYCMLEANHDPQKINEALINNDHRFEAEGGMRHLDEPQAWHYVEYNTKPDGYFIPLHASVRFGTLIQDLDETNK